MLKYGKKFQFVVGKGATGVNYREIDVTIQAPTENMSDADAWREIEKMNPNCLIFLESIDGKRTINQGK